MSRYRKSSHASCLPTYLPAYLLHYHVVFVPKNRKPASRGDVALRLRGLVREVCRSRDTEILRGHVRPDHVHLRLDVPTKWSPGRVKYADKGKTSHHLLQDFRRLRMEFGPPRLGTGYFVASSGNVTDELMAQYIESQGGEPWDEERFKIGK